MRKTDILKILIFKFENSSLGHADTRFPNFLLKLKKLRSESTSIKKKKRKKKDNIIRAHKRKIENLVSTHLFFTFLLITRDLIKIKKIPDKIL